LVRPGEFRSISWAAAGAALNPVYPGSRPVDSPDALEEERLVDRSDALLLAAAAGAAFEVDFEVAIERSFV
jgi:hypothetical protein